MGGKEKGVEPGQSSGPIALWRAVSYPLRPRATALQTGSRRAHLTRCARRALYKYQHQPLTTRQIPHHLYTVQPGCSGLHSCSGDKNPEPPAPTAQPPNTSTQGDSPLAVHPIRPMTHSRTVPILPRGRQCYTHQSDTVWDKPPKCIVRRGLQVFSIYSSSRLGRPVT